MNDITLYALVAMVLLMSTIATVHGIAGIHP
jgi:hypothetical protein